MKAGNKKRVLVCPLDWGLGHATRCIPLIREFIKDSADVVLAGDGYSIELLKQEFPELQAIRLKGYNIRLSKKLPLPLILVMQIPRLMICVLREHQQIRKITKDNNIDVIISDNRYGLWNNRVHTVFITHQLNILPPHNLRFLSPILRLITRWFIRKYDECWIPDVAGEDNSLSGKLSHGHPIPANTRFIGPLSRFDHHNMETNAALSMEENNNPEANSSPNENYREADHSTYKKYSELGQSGEVNHNSLSDHTSEKIGPYQIMAVLSGPEPQRSIFEKKVIEQLSLIPEKSLIIRGIPKKDKLSSHQEDLIEPCYPGGNVDSTYSLLTKSLYIGLKALPIIICRGGYSTLMDMAITGNKVICIPTPGQTEQIYLATKGAKEGKSIMADQENFSIKECLSRIQNTTGYNVDRSKICYQEAIEQLLAALP